MSHQPMVFARWGVYAALVLSIGSVVLAHNAGMAFDFAMMRGVFVFVLFTALAFGAEAVLSGIGAPPARPTAEAQVSPASVVEEESE